METEATTYPRGQNCTWEEAGPTTGAYLTQALGDPCVQFCLQPGDRQGSHMGSVLLQCWQPSYGQRGHRGPQGAFRGAACVCEEGRPSTTMTQGHRPQSVLKPTS